MRKLITILIFSPVIIFSQWNQLGADIDGLNANELLGSSVSINADGSRIAIGAPGPVNVNISGYVRVYEFDGSNWVQLGSDITGQLNQQFGFAIDLNSSGDRIVIGAPNDNTSGTSSGSVSIFDFDGTGWNQVGINLNGSNGYDQFGHSVSLNSNGNILAIGAPNAGSGYVKIYNLVNNFWFQLGSTLFASSSGNYPCTTIESKFGNSVGLNGDGTKLVVGAPATELNNNGGACFTPYSSYVGSIICFSYGSYWARIDDYAGSGGYSSGYFGDYLGYSVAINSDGDKIAAGMPGYKPGVSSSGHYGIGEVKFFTLTNTLPYNLNSNFSNTTGNSNGGGFGHSISLNSLGTKYIVSEPYSNSTGIMTGEVKIFSKNNLNTQWQIVSIHFGDNNNDNFGKSVAISSSGRRVVVGAPSNDGNGLNSGRVRVFACQPSYSTDFQTAGECYTWIDGVTYFSSSDSAASYTLTNVAGCDSIVNLNLTITSTTDSVIACDSYTWIDGVTYYSSNDSAASYAFINAAGCDSTVTLNLTISNSTTGIDVQTACDSYTWIDGNTYTSNNNSAHHITTNSAGCDHTNTLNLTITNATGVDTQTACDSYTWIDGNTYTSSINTPTHVVQTPSGCDSTLTLNLTITNASGVDIQSACNSYTWIDGNTYTSSTNTPTHVVQTPSGCDSTVILDLTISNSSNGVDIQTACNSFTWIDGNTYTTSNNIATHTLTNAAGCDSAITLNLTLNDNQFNVAFTSNQQVFTQPPFFTSFTNSTPNLNNFNFTWNFGDGDVVSSNAQTINHLYDYNGLYDVTLLASDIGTGCVDSLYQHEYIYCNGGQNPPLSVGEYKAGDITIYPNPTYDEISLKINDYQGPIKVQLHDLNGKLVKEVKERNIDLTSLESGVYTLLVNYGDKEMSLKVMKK